MRRLALALWLSAGVLSLASAASVFMPPRVSAYHVPETPVEMIAPTQSGQWKFLRQAWREMPRSVVYAVRAPNLHDEMSIYMMSLGMFVESQALAGSYFGNSRPGAADGAQVILALPCINPPPAGFDCKVIGEGCLCSRAGS